MGFTPQKPEERVRSWRERVPSRLERMNPFQDDGFNERPGTRLVSLLCLYSHLFYLLIATRHFVNRLLRLVDLPHA